MYSAKQALCTGHDSNSEVTLVMAYVTKTESKVKWYCDDRKDVYYEKKHR